MTNTLQINQHIWIDQNKLLGKGSTGNVYLGGSYRDPNLKFAVKAIDLSEVNNQVTQYLLSCQIVALSQLAKLNVQHIVKLHEIAFQEGFCYLCMELLEGGSLAEYIRENPNGLNEQQVQQLFRQLFQGYKSIRNLGIVHRDIKPDNIIFRHKPSSNLNSGQQKKTLCYIDFGYCTKQSVPNRPQVYYNVGSPKYMAPQAYKKNSYSQKSDLWALGIILYQMLHGKTIDKDMDMDEYMRFMEQSEIPFAKGVGMFMRRLVGGLLEVEVGKRVGCEEVEKMLKMSQMNTQTVQYVSNPQQQQQVNHHHQQQQQFVQFIPQLNFLQQSNNKRTSPFYRSQIITHRSDPSQILHNFHSHHHPLNPPLDPRRQQRNFSQQNELHEFGHSPKKIIHLQHTTHKVGRMLVPFESDKRQVVEKFKQFEQRNYSKQFIGGMGQVRRQLEKIQQEHDNDGSRHNLMRMNSSVQNFRVQPDMKRSFLKAMDQGQHLPPKANLQQNPPHITTNPNVRFLNTNNPFPINPSSPSRPYQLVRSQIFHLPPNKRFTSQNNTFFSSQINQNPQIKVITSDKTINNRGLQQQKVQLLGRNLNKSYSANNLMEKIQIRGENQPALVQSRFVPFVSSLGPKPIDTFNNQPIRPIDLLVQNKDIANNRAFLRNTMPNVYRSSIDPINFTVNQQPNDNHNRNLQNSKDLRHKETPIIEQVNHTNFKKHGSYFDQNFLTPQKQTNLQNNLTATQFKTVYPFTAIQNRNQKSHSFKVIQNNEEPHTMQRDRTMINLLNQSPSHMNQQQLQFNQQQMIEVNQQQQQQQAPISIVRQQLIQHSIQQQQPIHGKNVQINQQGQQLVPMGQVQGRNVFFGNVEQQPRNILQQNIHPAQTTFQMINQHQPTHTNDNQFRRSTIINLTQPTNQPPSIQLPQHHRSPIQNQNSSYQQPRPPVILDKTFFPQVSQPQRQILVNTINHNPEVNRMIRPTYPLGSQQPITVTQF